MSPAKKEMSDQTRAIVAAALSLVVILVFGRFFRSTPQEQPAQPPIVSQVNGANQPGSGAAPSSAGGATPAARAAAKAAAAAPTVPAIAAPAEQVIVVENGLYRLEFSNRGATVHSWELKKYADANNHALDLINAQTSQALDGWPFALTMDNSAEESAANYGLYQLRGASAANGPIEAPAEIAFVWSDGHMQVTKRFKFDDSYTIQVDSDVEMDGKPLAHSISWRGGFGDSTIVQRRGVTPTQVFDNLQGKIETYAAAKLGQPSQPSIRFTRPGPYEFAGIEDLYFAAAFLTPVTPEGQPAPSDITLTDWAPERDITTTEGKTTKTFIPQMAVGSDAGGPLSFRLYVGPKAIDALKAVRPPLNGLVQFGWFAFIAEPMFYALRWMNDELTHNYGWAIVLFAIAINVVLFPLKALGMRQAQKMQRVSPEIKSIQEKYKKYSMRDPRRQEMQKEIMAVYSREGINPLGSCWPQLIQFPIWYAVYRMLEYTIELRHAPWFGWIHDLSAPDPLYILPVALGLTGYVMTKMTPTPGVDPAQARMMSFMPLAFGFLFIFYPSGLSLYIMGSYVVGIAQQYYLNKTSPIKPAKALPRGKKKSSSLSPAR